MKEKKISPYYVINWDFNSDRLEHYDIMPYLVGCWKHDEENKKKRLRNLKRHKVRNFEAEAECKMPESFKDIKKWITDEAMYQFWSRCEYEVIVTGWPVQKHEHKLDVYEQIKMNIDVITKHFIDNI